MSSPNDADVTYSDKYLTLNSKGTLTVHNYWLSFRSSRILTISRIQNIGTVIALDVGRWEIKEWGVGYTWIAWAMDMSRHRFRVGELPDEIKRQLLVIRTDEGVWKRVGVTCEDVNRFLVEVEKMGVHVLRDKDRKKVD
jgi:hypothetical protein